MFLRRRARAARGALHEPADHRVTAVVVFEDDAEELDAAAAREQARAALRAIAAEAVIHQDAAEQLLADVRARLPLAELAPRGGHLASRFVALRRALPETDDPQLRRHVAVLRKVFDHHALMLSCSLELLSVDWRSERMVEELEKIDGLGAPAQWLEAVRAELEAGRAPAF
jgi:hypothetical protein